MISQAVNPPRNRVNSRIAEALVESIFRRARYRVTRVGRESHVPGLLRQGPAEFSPDFIVWKPVPSGTAHPEHLYRLLAIEVKYRADLEQFLGRELRRLIDRVRE